MVNLFGSRSNKYPKIDAFLVWNSSLLHKNKAENLVCTFEAQFMIPSFSPER